MNNPHRLLCFPGLHRHIPMDPSPEYTLFLLKVRLAASLPSSIQTAGLQSVFSGWKYSADEKPRQREDGKEEQGEVRFLSSHKSLCIMYWLFGKWWMVIREMFENMGKNGSKKKITCVSCTYPQQLLIISRMGVYSNLCFNVEMFRGSHPSDLYIYLIHFTSKEVAYSSWCPKCRSLHLYVVRIRTILKILLMATWYFI